MSEKQKTKMGGRATSKVCRVIGGVFTFSVRAEEEWNRGFIESQRNPGENYEYAKR